MRKQYPQGYALKTFKGFNSDHLYSCTFKFTADSQIVKHECI